MADFTKISEALIKGDAKTVKELTEQAVAEGIAPGEIIQQGLIAGMSVIAERFKKNEIYVPEVLIAARAMHAGLGVLKPLLTESETEAAEVFLIGTVKGDLHDIGKNLVAMMMEGAGFRVVDLGVDVPPEKFVEAIREHKPSIVGLSALLTTTMVAMKDTLEAIKASEFKDKVKVMVGGAPVTQNYADEIGADGYAPDASTAVDVAKKLIGAA
ncbi:MAG: cobalamin-binding protein [Firmicutes bacterium]|jgi:5-methyltetrahydrofolate--homocysteine methyltransferase|nr:cobalamin-binding protein [Bacillota bacterium]